jgi:predicted DNA-binding transcriptional regulator AlpA
MSFSTSVPDNHWLELQRVIDEKKAADLGGISVDTLRRMSARGEGPRRIKLSPRRVGYRMAEVLAWLKAQSGAADDNAPGRQRETATAAPAA